MNALKTMRNMGFLKILLWIIVISFVAAMFTVWGTGGSSGKSGRGWLGEDYAVKVESRTISSAVFRFRYKIYSDRLRQMFGSSFKEEYLRGASRTVADGMARDLILQDMAKEYRLTVSDEELAAAIERTYGFRDLKTDYSAMISRMGLTAGEFESMFRTEMLSMKLNDFLADSVYLADADVRAQYVEQNEGVKAMIASIANSTYAAKVPPPTDAEIQARYDRDKASLLIPEKRTMDFLLVNPTALRAGLKVDDAQVKAYYDSHKSDFAVPADQRRASHILIKVDEKASPAELDAARKKAQEAYDKAKAGQDFGALAKATSQDSSSANGGDLGWFDRNRMVKPFADAVFDQCKSVGDVVGPVQSQFGFHVIKLTGIGGETKSFDEVKAQARQALIFKDTSTAERVKTLQDEASKALADAKDDVAVKAVAAKYGLTITPVAAPFGMKEYVPGIGNDPAVLSAVASAAQGQWAPPIKFRDGIMRFKVNSILPTHPAKFDEVRDSLATDIRTERQSALARAAAQTLAGSAKDAASLEAEAKKAGYTVQQSALLKASDALPGAGKSPEAMKSLLAASVGQVVGPVKTQSGYVVAIVTEHPTLDEKKFASEKDSFALKQKQEAGSQLVDAYIQRRRATLEKEKKISFNQELLDSMEPNIAPSGGPQGGSPMPRRPMGQLQPQPAPRPVPPPRGAVK